MNTITRFNKSNQQSIYMYSNSVKVSVIVPIYNVEPFIERCVRSLMNQTLENIEYIFVNDCTPDNSINILKSILKEYPDRNVHIIHHSQNKGLAAARKTGLSQAKGKYIVHCDSDDWVDANMYKYMLEIAEQNNADIVACGFKTETPNTTCEVQYPYKTETIDNILDPNKIGWIYGAVWNKMILKDLYIRNNISPIEGINMWEDSLITIPLRLNSSKTVIIPNTFYHYWIGQRASTFFSSNNLNKVNEMIQATKILEDYLSHNFSNYNIQPFISKLKLICKERLMSTPNHDTFIQWRNTYPDNDLSVWQFKSYSLTTKIKISLIHLLPKYLAYPIFCLRRNKK